MQPGKFSGVCVPASGVRLGSSLLLCVCVVGAMKVDQLTFIRGRNLQLSLGALSSCLRAAVPLCHKLWAVERGKCRGTKTVVTTVLCVSGWRFVITASHGNTTPSSPSLPPSLAD